MFRVLATFRTVFWSLFGRGEPDAVKLGDYNNSFTEDVGYFIYGVYNIVMVTVLINMLIAMMTRSFTNIAVSIVTFIYLLQYGRVFCHVIISSDRLCS